MPSTLDDSRPYFPGAGLALVLILLLLSSSLTPATPAVATPVQPLTEPVRITFNTVEDQTSSGSLMEICNTYYAAWLQQQAGAGWRIMWAEGDLYSGWSMPQPLDPAPHLDRRVRMAVWDGFPVARHAVWQRDTGDGAEIMHGEWTGSGAWSIKPITSNTLVDLTPAIADPNVADGRIHVAWTGGAGGEGHIHYAVRENDVWEIEVLTGSELGPFWEGAEPRIAVQYDGTVHIVYRGGDFGDYHAHHARKSGGVWTYGILTSGNINDLNADVCTRGYGRIIVAMSGNDGWGMPYRVYVRESQDNGATFDSPILASGPESAILYNVVDGIYYGQIVAAQVSGNILTGNLLLLTEQGGWFPEELEPMNGASENPSTSQAMCIGATSVPGGMSVLYTNHGGHGADSTEVYFMGAPIPGAVGDEEGQGVRPATLRIDAAPNPFSAETWISVAGGGVPGSGAERIGIYDVSGRLVRRLSTSRGQIGAVARRFRWDGSDLDGRAVPAGVYFLRSEPGGAGDSRSVIVIR